MAIPTPPATIKSPVVVDVDCVPCDNVRVFDMDVSASNLTSLLKLTGPSN